MPYIKKSEQKEFEKNTKTIWNLQDEFERHDEFVKKYEGSWASMNRDSNFAELKSKRDLLQKILSNGD